MKDLRDLMSMIEEGQYAFDDSHDYFQGVWDSFKKINNLSVPDAVMPLSQDMIRHQAKRVRNISANQHRMKADLDRDAVLDEADETTFAKLSSTKTNNNTDDKK